VETRYLRAELYDVIDLSAYGEGGGIVVLAVEEWGDMVLPIIIGGWETFSILKGLGQISFPRPLTHDLMVTLFEELGVVVERVTIDANINSTYVATLVLRSKDGRELRFDARPSDAIAIAVRVDAPIYVADVLKKYAEDLNKLMSLLRRER